MFNKYFQYKSYEFLPSLVGDALNVCSGKAYRMKSNKKAHITKVVLFLFAVTFNI